MALTFPYLAYHAQSIPCNNDIETWLPRESPVRAAYEQFKSDFGVEEIVLIAVERQLADDELLEAVCGRVERLPGVRKCMSPDRLRSVMGETGVSSDQAVNRLKGLALSGDEKLAGLIVLPLFVWAGYSSNKPAWANAMIQTAGVLLGGAPDGGERLRAGQHHDRHPVPLAAVPEPLQRAVLDLIRKRP